MKKLLAVAALALALVAPRASASTYSVTTDASSTTLKLAGRFRMPNLSGVDQLIVDSVKGLFTWTYGIQASTASFTGTGNTTYSVVTSSGIQVNGGAGVVASWFQATSNFFGNLVGNVTGNVTGNATTATTATNLASGGAGSIPYQTGSGATSFVSSVANSVLSIVGTTPTWLSFIPNSVTISTQNVSPGFNAANEFLQVGSDGKLPTIDGSKLTGISGTLTGGQNGFAAYWTGATTLSVAPEVVTASSMTDTGPRLEQSSVTLNNGVLTSTANYSAPVINAEWTAVASTHVWGAASATWLYNIVSTVPAPGCLNVYPAYKLSINAFAGGTAGNFGIRFSTGPGLAVDQSAANYTYTSVDEGSGPGTTAGTDSTYCPIGYPGSAASNVNPISGDFIFAPKPNNDHRVRGTFYGWNVSVNSDVAQINSVSIEACDWGHTTNIGPLYALQFFNTAGTFTGDFTLYMKCGK